MKHLYLPLPCVGILLAGPALGQAPTITGVQPAVNALAASPSAPLVVTFSQPLTAASGAALRVFSSQRGGLRTAGAGSAAVVSGNTLIFKPQSYGYRAGETVGYTLTTAAAGSGGALARPVVGQFTVATQGPGSSTFGQSVTTADGITPTAVAAADIDADGDLDLLTANTNSEDVSILRNNGRGTFGPSQRVAAEHPNSLSVGDLDGDGDLDFVTSINYWTQAVSVRLNNGTGTFSAAPSVATSFPPGDTALGDLDGDGDLDLLVVERVGAGNGRVWLFLNTGNGTFKAGGSFATGYVPGKLALGDLDGDGDLDCVVADYGSETNGYVSASVTVALNAGNATFAQAPAVSVSISPLDVALGDLDGDGDLDMMVASSGYPNFSNLSIRLNAGNGTFSPSNGQNLALPSSTNGVVLGDLDGDGDLDVAATITGYTTGAGAQYERVVYTARNLGSGRFVASQTVYVGQQPYALTLADLDGDQDLDLATANSSSNYSVSLNQSALPTHASQSAPAFTLAPNPAQPATAVRGAAPYAPVRVLDALGRTVLQATADAEGTARLAWPAPPASGVYVVQAGPQSQRLVVLE